MRALPDEHDLADMRARLHARMRLGGVKECERAVDHDPNLSRGDQRPDIALDRLRNCALVRNGAGAKRRAGMVQALEHDAAEIDGCARGALERDLDDAALDCGCLVIALDIVASD